MGFGGSAIWIGLVPAVVLWTVFRQAQIMRSNDPDSYVGWPFADGSNRNAQTFRLVWFSIGAASLLAALVAALLR